MPDKMRKVPFNAVSAVLNKVLSNLGLDKRFREHTFMGLWPTLVSSALAERSRPLFIDAERNLVVSVADAASAQELSMVKGQLLKKLLPAARGLGIDMRGLRVDLKHYHSTSTSVRIEEERPLPKPTAEELKALTLRPSDEEQLKQLSAELAADPSCEASLRAKIRHAFESELRLRLWRLQHNYPSCPGCGNPAERLHAPSAAHQLKRQGPPVCITCLFEDQP